jgi:hypothetical protein
MLSHRGGSCNAGRTLTVLELAAEQTAGSVQVDRAAVDLIARTTQRAVEVCQQIAHGPTARVSYVSLE